MAHEPDWKSLGELQFLLHQRIAEQLNAALAAVQLVGAPESQDAPPGFWQQRASDAVLRALDLENAWASLIRNKLGEHFVPQQMAHFHASDLIRWLATEIQSPQYTTPGEDVLLVGNRETLQEALLLVHSCAGALGPHVRLVIGLASQGVWFRMRFDVVRQTPPTLGLLRESLASAGNWRSEAALFELQRAEDFLTMNSCALHYNVTADYAELAFCVPSVHPTSGKTSAAVVLDEDTARAAHPATKDRLSTPVVAKPDDDAHRPAGVS